MGGKKRKKSHVKTVSSPVPFLNSKLNTSSGIRWAALTIAVAAALAYSNSFSGPFIFDDGINIVENDSIRSLWPWHSLFAPAESGLAGRPVVNFTLALNDAVSGKEVWSYHALNLLIHILAGLTLFGIVRLTLLSKTLCERFGHHSTGLAFLCALLWVLHPVQTQSVTYIIQRCESLMGLFFLLTLYGAIRGWRSHSANRWHALAIAACLLGTGSKEIIAVAPFAILLYDVTFNKRRIGEAIRHSKILYGGLLVCLILLGLLIAFAGKDSAGNESPGFTAWQYALTQTQVIAHYLRLSAWPSSLCLDYGWPIAGFTQAFPYLLLILLLLIPTLWGVWRRHPLAYPAAWFFITIAPSSSFIPIRDIAFEHRMYLPLAGMIAFAVLGGIETFRFMQARFHLTETRARQAAVSGCVLALIAAITLGVLTYHRNWDYRSELAIWSDTAAKQPDNPRSNNNTGSNLIHLGYPKKAIPFLRDAVRLQPDYANARHNLGTALLQTGDSKNAITHFHQALQADPGYTNARYNLGCALLLNNDPNAAIQHFQKVLDRKEADLLHSGKKSPLLESDLADVHDNLARAFYQAGDAQKAITHFEETLRLVPDNAVVHNNLGAILAQSKRVDDAVTHFRKAIQIESRYADAHRNLGRALEQIGKPQEALRHYQEALRIKPNDASARKNVERLMK